MSERYGRHIRLAQIGEAGQRRLEAAQVLIVGLGGLGSPVAMYLAASGVGRLVLSDYDHVELSNLQRQIVHRSRDIGRNKVDSARDTLLALNPEIEVIALDRALDEDLDAQVEAADVVVDATDNFESRFALNAACWRQRTPLVSGAAIRMEGQIAVFDPADPKSPCYRCLYRDSGGAEGEPCALVGVLAPLLGIIGSVQATETLKLITGFGDTLAGRLIVLDAALMEWRELRLPKDPACPVCGPSPSSIASCASRAEP
ncbi:MAG: molybdopterin-synthase adenylyltransferase MoeB [Ectothiorhodospiraceae bacterium AqS1]|nr:molybdopterin-synthase adenylyltransferase MoeB [Ectothiorhodospiraceae bacterium AqS1]